MRPTASTAAQLPVAAWQQRPERLATTDRGSCSRPQERARRFPAASNCLPPRPSPRGDWDRRKRPRLDAPHAKSPQRRDELAQGRANAIEERGVARRLVNPILRRGDRPLQIICDRQSSAAKSVIPYSRASATLRSARRRVVSTSARARSRRSRRDASAARPRRAPGRRPTGLLLPDGLCHPNPYAPSG